MPWWGVLFSSTMLVFDFFFPFVFTFWNSYCLGVGLPRLSLQIPCLFSFLSYFLYLWVFALLFHEISSILLSNPSSFHFCHHLYVFLIPESSFVWSFSIATLSLFFGGGLHCLLSLWGYWYSFWSCLLSAQFLFSTSWFIPACFSLLAFLDLFIFKDGPEYWLKALSLWMESANCRMIWSGYFWS